MSSDSQIKELIALSNSFFGIVVDKDGKTHSAHPKRCIKLIHNESKIVQEKLCDAIDEDTKVPPLGDMVSYAAARLRGEKPQGTKKNTICRAAFVSAAAKSLYSVVDAWVQDLGERAEKEEEEETENGEYLALFNSVSAFQDDADEMPYEEVFDGLTDGNIDPLVDAVHDGDGGPFMLCVDAIPELFFLTGKRKRA